MHTCCQLSAELIIKSQNTAGQYNLAMVVEKATRPRWELGLALQGKGSAEVGLWKQMVWQVGTDQEELPEQGCLSEHWGQCSGAIPLPAIWLVITSGSLASQSSVTSAIEAAHTIRLGTTGADYVFLEVMLCFFGYENKAQGWDLSLATPTEAR